MMGTNNLTSSGLNSNFHTPGIGVMLEHSNTDAKTKK